MSSFFDLVASLQASVDDLDSIISGSETETVSVNGVSKDTISKAIKDKFTALLTGQRSGVIVFTNYALLDAYTPTVEQRTASYKVSNDPVTSKNGFYHWVSGSAYVKDSELVQNVIDENNNSEGVSGKAVFDLVDPVDHNAFQNHRNLTEGGQQIHDSGVRQYSGAGNIPILTDQLLKVLMSYNVTTEEIEAVGLMNIVKMSEELGRIFGSTGPRSFTGTGVYPVITDANLNVLLGFDDNTKELVGAFPRSSSSTKVKILEPLPLSLIPSIKKHNHIISYGQSLSVGAGGKPALSLTQPYSNLTFNGGPRAAAGDYSALKPLIEDELDAPDGGTTRGETICSGAANYAVTKLITENGMKPNDHIILATAPGHGGYKISQLEKGTVWYDTTLTDHITNGHSLDVDHAIHAFSWMQGENDISSGETFTTYRDKLAQLQVDMSADSKLITGQTHDVFCITYQMSFSILVNEDMALAQLDLVKNNENFYLSTPMYNMIYSDTAHLTNTSYKIMGAYVGRAYKQLVIDNVKPPFLNPISSIINDKTVTVNFDVPFLPLVFDDMNVGSITDYGFVVTDNDVAATIVSIITKGSQVIIELSAAPVGVVEVRYALDYAGTTATSGSAGNLRDSCKETATIGGIEKPLYYICPHFKQTAITLGE